MSPKMWNGYRNRKSRLCLSVPIGEETFIYILFISKKKTLNFKNITIDVYFLRDFYCKIFKHFFFIKEIKMSIFPSMEVELCNMSSPLHWKEDLNAPENVDYGNGKMLILKFRFCSSMDIVLHYQLLSKRFHSSKLRGLVPDHLGGFCCCFGFLKNV